MASACVNNIGVSSESFLDCPPAKFSSYGWLSPRISFGRESPDGEASKAAVGKAMLQFKSAAEETDLEASLKDIGDFEFCLEDPVNMLPADELFSDGKLVPLQLSMLRPEITPSEVRQPDMPKLRRRNEISVTDPNLFSPKAPRCSSGWKELLGLKKLYQNSNNAKHENNHKTVSSSAPKSFKNFLHRSSKSSSSSSGDSLNLPLLRDTVDNDSSVSLSSSRLSLSSSSSGHEHDDLPRLSLDADKPARVSIYYHKSHVVKTRSSENSTGGGVRVGRSPMRRQPSAQPETVSVRGVSVDSPRMNSSGKIVFHSLERSSSSPSSFNGGPKYHHHHHNKHNRAMERSYSANVVRVTPVLNLPVCSSLRSSSKSAGVFGLPLFSSSSNNKAVHHNVKFSTGIDTTKKSRPLARRSGRRSQNQHRDAWGIQGVQGTNEGSSWDRIISRGSRDLIPSLEGRNPDNQGSRIIFSRILGPYLL